MKTTLATYRGNKYALEYLCQSFIYNCLNPMNPLSTLLPNTKKKDVFFIIRDLNTKVGSQEILCSTWGLSSNSQHTYIYIHVYIYMCIYIHTHTHTKFLCYLFGQN